MPATQTPESPESRLKEMLGLTKISHSIVIEELDTLAVKGVDLYATIGCDVRGRSNRVMQKLEKKGFIRTDDIRSNETHNYYTITDLGRDIHNLAQEYLMENK